MDRSLVIAQYIKISFNMQIDDYHDVLTDDFYFRNPRIEIFGKNNYIKYACDSQGLCIGETVKLTKVNEDKYIHVFNVPMFEKSSVNPDKFCVIQEISLKNGLISSSIYTYDLSELSDTTNEFLENIAQKHGKPI
ncbi:MAG: hypothetical protein HRU29_11460 [Rhizobiales bacterium]|nr:hypothetical protein [Hyphomicrobiales bacterium]NRB15006.1 hypothetical protein [Hyphomicrobiales bacterium]